MTAESPVNEVSKYVIVAVLQWKTVNFCWNFQCFVTWCLCSGCYTYKWVILNKVSELILSTVSADNADTAADVILWGNCHCQN